VALIKKRDVPSYFAQRKRRGMLLNGSTSRPDATGFSGGEPGRASIKSKPTVGNALGSPSLIGADIPASNPADSPGKFSFRNAQS
jgi:hypothetical protein